MFINQIANRTVEFALLTGTVISSQKHSETHVTSTGGGGVLYKGSGHVSAPVVRSHIVTKHEFWVRTEDGQEIPANLSNANVSVAEGQKVSLITASVVGATAAPLVLVVNHNAKGHWFIPPHTTFINAMHEPIKLWPIGLIAVTLVIGLRYPVVALAGIGFAFYRLFRRRSLVKASTARLRTHLEGVAQSLHASPAQRSTALPALPPLPSA